MTKKKQFTLYIIYTFVLSWILQIIASIFALKGNQVLFSVILAFSMFIPLVGAILAKFPIKEMGWKPVFKGHIKSILMAWFLPAILGLLGAGLYFILFPSTFDTSMSYISSTLGAEGLAQLAEQGLTPKTYAIITVVLSLTYAPLINMFFAVGEEAGWRGAMYPVLKEKFGTVKGRLIGGAIWGVWHWPVIILAGYEYGTEYWGAPVVGPLLFCVITISMGIIFDYLYDKTKCIWVPALAHGAINAFAGIPTMFLAAGAQNLLLGPLMVGIIGGLPMILTAVYISLRHK